MNLALEDNIPCVEEMLQTILHKPQRLARVAVSCTEPDEHSEAQTVSEAVYIAVGIYINAGDGV